MQVPPPNAARLRIFIEGAPAQDLAAIAALLASASLPSADVTKTSLQGFLVARLDNHIVGVVGVECYQEVGLLRSLVVARERSGLGIGKELVAAAEKLAAESRIRSLYLLTTSADRFFAGLGFRRLPRELAPLAIQSTSQFSSLCPTSAVLMGKP